MHGYETTVPVTLEMMILQGRAVMRGSQQALVVVDMPFGSYEASREQAFHSAVRILKETQCGAVKLEGGERMAETVAFLTQRGIPVMGHIGLTPQSINTLGSFRAQGREEGSWEPIENDARAISEAGAFSIVIEAVAEPWRARSPRRSQPPPLASARARRATARCWCSRTCWGYRRARQSSCAAMATLAPRSKLRSRAMPPTSARVAFPVPNTSTE